MFVERRCEKKEMSDIFTLHCDNCGSTKNIEAHHCFSNLYLCDDCVEKDRVEKGRAKKKEMSCDSERFEKIVEILDRTLKEIDDLPFVKTDIYENTDVAKHHVRDASTIFRNAAIHKRQEETKQTK